MKHENSIQTLTRWGGNLVALGAWVLVPYGIYRLFKEAGTTNDFGHDIGLFHPGNETGDIEDVKRINEFNLGLMQHTFDFWLECKEVLARRGASEADYCKVAKGALITQLDEDGQIPRCSFIGAFNHLRYPDLEQQRQLRIYVSEYNQWATMVAKWQAETERQQLAKNNEAATNYLVQNGYSACVPTKAVTGRKKIVALLLGVGVFLSVLAQTFAPIIVAAVVAVLFPLFDLEKHKSDANPHYRQPTKEEQKAAFAPWGNAIALLIIVFCLFNWNTLFASDGLVVLLAKGVASIFGSSPEA
jgi:hypothetical protein